MATVLAIALLSVPSLVRAEQKVDYAKRLAILPIVVEGKEGGISMSGVFEAITRATKTRADLRVITYEEMFVASQEGLVEQIRNCGPDEACLSGRMRRFNARYGVVVLLNFELTPILMSIQVLDTDLGKKVGERLLEIETSDQAPIVQRLEQEADGLLTEMGFRPSGRLVVEVDPPNATLVVDESTAPDLGSAGVFTLPAGHYRVRAAAEGWDPGVAEADVRSGEVTTVKLALSEQTTVWQSPWLWIAAGIVVIGATTSVVAVTQRPDECFCVTFKGDGCGCP